MFFCRVSTRDSMAGWLKSTLHCLSPSQTKLRKTSSAFWYLLDLSSSPEFNSSKLLIYISIVIVVIQLWELPLTVVTFSLKLQYGAWKWQMYGEKEHIFHDNIRLKNCLDWYCLFSWSKFLLCTLQPFQTVFTTHWLIAIITRIKTFMQCWIKYRDVKDNVFK